ncbi:MAG: hypothetical protein KIT72_12650 [Polyangiaceae bacterium]|nr:hypothetical protein [Polyangiaceae bacterium]MCW5791262.1 hypothetical protein [Polyangiaceae bacterium]
MRRSFSSLLVLAHVGCALSFASLARADFSDWGDDPGGATYVYSNRAAAIPWENEMGDWFDAAGDPQGSEPFATFTILRNTTRFEVDVTTLVQQWADGTLRADGFYLRSSSGTANLHSREADDPAVRPTLELDTDEGTLVLDAEADTGISRSTVQPQGGNRTYGLGTALVRFPRAEIVGKTITGARLVMHRSSPTGGDTQLQVLACRQPRDVLPVEHGFAKDFERDQGIASHPDVYAAMDFSGDSWTADHPLWSARGGTVIDETSAVDVANGFEPLDGPAVRWGFAEGANGGGGATLSFFSLPENERPEELYSRYYVRFGKNFTPTVDGGKMPGFSFRPDSQSPSCNGGSPDIAGTKCWSARGSFTLMAPAGNPFEGFFGLGYYVYHTQQSGPYGSGWRWNIGYEGMVTEGRWYAVEEYVRINTTGQPDGVLRAWVNGRLVFQRTDILFRNSDHIRVGQVWYNIYHGGTAKAPHDMYFWVDNLVVAKSYVGPLGGVPDAPPLLEDGTLVPGPGTGGTSGGGAGGSGGGNSGGSGGNSGGSSGSSSHADGDASDDGGCGCRTAGGSSALSPWGVGALALAWLLRRRARGSKRGAEQTS